jgi:hypothetical protein
MFWAVGVVDLDITKYGIATAFEEREASIAGCIDVFIVFYI